MFLQNYRGFFHIVKMEFVFSRTLLTKQSLDPKFEWLTSFLTKYRSKVIQNLNTSELVLLLNIFNSNGTCSVNIEVCVNGFHLAGFHCVINVLLQ